ncbi:MAG: hypothetical protein M3H12_07250 [Chromatiales bacterium]|nr:hypothetical protein [Gammaproteobacteria bacterium]
MAGSRGTTIISPARKIFFPGERLFTGAEKRFFVDGVLMLKSVTDVITPKGPSGKLTTTRLFFVGRNNTAHFIERLLADQREAIKCM